MNIEKEKISDEQLDRVSGGTAEQTADDSRFLNSLNGSTNRYGAFKISIERYDDKIAEAWAALGVTAVIHTGNLFYGGSDNEYYIGTKKVTQFDARHHAMKVVGKQMKYNEWHY